MATDTRTFWMVGFAPQADELHRSNYLVAATGD
jgi:hypothetical protein